MLTTGNIKTLFPGKLSRPTKVLDHISSSYNYLYKFLFYSRSKIGTLRLNEMYGAFLLFLFLMFDNLEFDFKDTESPRLYISLLLSGHNNLCTLLFLCVFYKVGTLIYQLPISSLEIIQFTYFN